MKTSSTTNLIACVTIVGAITVGFATGPAFAQTDRDRSEFEFAFSYAPSELQTAPGAEKLLARLESEVRERCAPDRRMTSEQRTHARTCVAETMQKTIFKFNSTAVAEAYGLRAAG